MNCVNCNAPNDLENIFCVNCGNAVTGISGMPTVPFQQPAQPFSQGYSLSDSTETAVVNLGQPPPRPTATPYAPNAPYSGEYKTKKTNPIIWIAIGLVAALVIVGIAAVIIVPRIGGGEVLPDHSGMFVQSAAKDRNDEISTQDFSKVIEARVSLLKNDNLSALEPQPNLIFYFDGKDIPASHLRLIQLDSVKDDGSMKQLKFQILPVDGKPAMNRIRMLDSMANGKYAFASLDGYFDEGKHKFWAFQVRSSGKSDNGDLLETTTFPMKPKDAPSLNPAPNITRVPAPQPAIVPPPGPQPLGLRAVRADHVRVRMGPSMSASFHPTFRFNRGSTVNVIAYTGYECPSSGKGCGPWAQIEGGYYVHSSLLR